MLLSRVLPVATSTVTASNLRRTNSSQSSLVLLSLSTTTGITIVGRLVLCCSIKNQAYTLPYDDCHRIY